MIPTNEKFVATCIDDSTVGSEVFSIAGQDRGALSSQVTVNSAFPVEFEDEGFSILIDKGLEHDSGVATFPDLVNSSFATGGGPTGGVVTPDGLELYVVNETDNDVRVFDTTDNTQIGSDIVVGTDPDRAVVTPDGAFVYVTNGGSDNVSKIDTATKAVVATITVGDQPRGIIITPNGLEIYVTNITDGTVSVIQTSTDTVSDTITVGTLPVDECVHPDGTFVYVSNITSGTLSKINTATKVVDATITVGTSPWGCAITPDGLFVHVANNGDDDVDVISTLTDAIVDSYDVNDGPRGVEVRADGKYLYVSNEAVSDNLSKVKLSTNTVVQTITVGTDPNFVALTPDDNFIYAFNKADNDVEYIQSSETKTGMLDSTESWTDDEHVGRVVKFSFGPGAGQSSTIISNTDKGLIFSPAIPIPVIEDTNVTIYRIIESREVFGTATAGSSNTLRDETQNMPTDIHEGQTLTITAGTGFGDDPVTIVSNTFDEFTVTPAFTTIPDSTSAYKVEANWKEGDEAHWTATSDDAGIYSDFFRDVFGKPIPVAFSGDGTLVEDAVK